MWQYNHTDELMHFGIKGMKWGVRRYQNKDGSLTPAGKKRLSKEYKKYAIKAHEDINKNEQKRFVKAHNKAVDDLNDGLIDKYNADYDKKLGSKAKNHDYGNDEEYNRGMNELYSKLLSKYYNQETAREFKNNENYRKAKELCDEYDMTSFDDLARDNEEIIREMSKLLD